VFDHVGDHLVHGQDDPFRLAAGEARLPGHRLGHHGHPLQHAGAGGEHQLDHLLRPAGRNGGRGRPVPPDEGHQGDVVGLGLVAGKRRNRCHDCVRHLPGGRRRRGAGRFEETGHAVLLLPRVLDVGHAVGVHDQGVARRQHELRDLVVRARHHAQRDPRVGPDLLGPAVGAAEHRRIVPGADQPRPAGVRMILGVEQGHEQARLVVLEQQMVGPPRDLRRRVPAPGHGPHEQPGHGHEKGRRGALAGHVGHDDAHRAAGEAEEVEVVAAHLPGRPVVAVHVEAVLELRERRELPGQDAALDVGGDHQLLVVPLFLGGAGLDVLDLVQDGLAEAVEGARQAADLPGALVFDQPVGIVALGVAVGLTEEPGQRLGDRVGHRQQQHHDQPHDDDGDGDHGVLQLDQGLQHDVARRDDGQGPADGFDPGVDDQRRLARVRVGHVHEVGRRVPQQPGQLLEVRVRGPLGDVPEALVGHQLTGDLAAPADEPACLRHHEGLAAAPRREPFQPVHQLGQGDVHRGHAHQLALAPDGVGVGGHQDVAAADVQVRLGPVPPPVGQRLPEPVPDRVVVSGVGQRLEFQVAAGGAAVIGGVAPQRRLVRDEGDRAAVDARIPRKRALEQQVDGLGGQRLHAAHRRGDPLGHLPGRFEQDIEFPRVGMGQLVRFPVDLGQDGVLALAEAQQQQGAEQDQDGGNQDQQEAGLDAHVSSVRQCR